MRSAVSLPSCCAASSAVMDSREEESARGFFHAILDPLAGFPEHRRCYCDDVARVDGHFAETPADIRRDDADLVFGQAHVSGHEREDRTNGVWRLGGHPHRQLPETRSNWATQPQVSMEETWMRGI